MLIPLLSTMLDRLELNGKARVDCTRSVLRVLLKLDLYTEAKASIRDHIGFAKERELSVLFNELIWNEFLQVKLWRAVYDYVNNRDEDAVRKYGMSPADLHYVLNMLKATDVTQMRYSQLDYTQPPLSKINIETILKKCNKSVKYYAGKLRFVPEIEPGFEISDFVADLQIQALYTIYRYESSRSLEHIINTVQQTLSNSWRDTCDKWNAEKRTGGGRIKHDTGKVRNGKTVFDYENRSMRAAVTIQGEDGSVTENPELAKRAVTIDSHIEIRDMIDKVLNLSEPVGKYLKIICLDEDDPDCYKWVQANMRLTKKEIREGKYDEKFAEHVRQYCQITQKDMRRTMKFFRKNFGKTPIITKAIKEKAWKTISL